MIFLLIITTLANSWIWKIAGTNFLLFLILSLAPVFFYLSSKKVLFRFISILLLIIIAFFQWQTTISQSLVLLDNDEQRIHQMRLNFYNPSQHYIRVLFKRLNLKEFLEGDFNTVFSRVQRNFFETIDPNVYFFAGHPRERVWASDFEKFPFILVLPFLLGLYQIILKKDWLLILTTLLSIILLSSIGHKNPVGPFLLFPFIVISIFYGVTSVLGNIKK